MYTENICIYKHIDFLYIRSIQILSYINVKKNQNKATTEFIYCVLHWYAEHLFVYSQSLWIDFLYFHLCINLFFLLLDTKADKIFQHPIENRKIYKVKRFKTFIFSISWFKLIHCMRESKLKIGIYTFILCLFQMTINIKIKS